VIQKKEQSGHSKEILVPTEVLLFFPFTLSPIIQRGVLQHVRMKDSG
jgi:hypothetical protein